MSVAAQPAPRAPEGTETATATYSLRTCAQDRTYYRVCCRGPAGEQVFDLFHDAVSNLWVLDVAHDWREVPT